MAKKSKTYTVDQPRGSGKTRRGAASPDTAQPEFDTVESVRKTVENMQLLENERARDRALIDVLANGERPYSPQEVEEYQVQFNINWGELKKSVRDANAQINGALLFKPVLFTGTCKGGAPEKRDVYSQKFTTKINDAVLMDEQGSKFRFLIKSRNASVTLHGPGIMYWPNDYDVLPQFVPLENFLVPTDTLLDFSNCSYFDIKTELTPYELYERTHGGDTVDENWNMEQVDAILEALEEMGTLNTNNYNWVQHPEKMQEIFKQNRCYLNSDAVAKVKLDYFFSKQNDGNWFLKIFTREGLGEADPDVFVYESDKPFADSLHKIIHVQYGDNSLVPPLKFHSVRGIGTDNYSPAWALNMFRSDLFQHAKEQMRMYLRIANPADKGRENMVNLQQYGILENGISFVPQSERHQIDTDLVDNVIAQCRQNVAENSSSYVQDIDNGTEKEQTLGEAKIRQMTANQNVSTLLTMMYFQETPFYQETTRRYLTSDVSEAKAFRDDCISDGIPKELMVYSNWRIDPDKVLGAGDQSLALGQASALYQARTGFDPKTQRMISRQFVSTLTQDPAKGLLYVPDAPDNSDSGTQNAEDVFGTLMQGVQVSLRQGIEQLSYCTTLLTNAGLVIQRITQADNVGTPSETLGLATVINDVQKHVQILAADPTMKMQVKQLGDQIGQMSNLIKAFDQRQQAANKQSNPKLIENLNFKDLEGFGPAQAAFLQKAGLPSDYTPQTDPKVVKAQQGMQIKAAQFSQKSQQSAISFQIQQIQKLTEHQANLSQAEREHNQELVHAAAQKIQELYMASIQPPEPASQN